jgi:hypothetical protein
MVFGYQIRTLCTSLGEQHRCQECDFKITSSHVAGDSQRDGTYAGLERMALDANSERLVLIQEDIIYATRLQYSSQWLIVWLAFQD